MSIETANTKRYEKGLMSLTPLEGELLTELEISTAMLWKVWENLGSLGAKKQATDNDKIIAHAHGDS